MSTTSSTVRTYQYFSSVAIVKQYLVMTSVTYATSLCQFASCILHLCSGILLKSNNNKYFLSFSIVIFVVLCDHRALKSLNKMSEKRNDLINFRNSIANTQSHSIFLKILKPCTVFKTPACICNSNTKDWTYSERVTKHYYTMLYYTVLYQIIVMFIFAEITLSKVTKIFYVHIYFPFLCVQVLAVYNKVEACAPSTSTAAATNIRLPMGNKRSTMVDQFSSSKQKEWSSTTKSS